MIRVMGNPLAVLTEADLRRRTSVKWRTYADDVLPMFVAEMDTPLAPPIRDVLKQALDEGDTGYPYGDEYAAALADFAEQRWGWRFEKEQARLAADVITGAVETLRLVTDPGDAVVLSPPVYHPFFHVIAHAERSLVEAPLRPDGRLDFTTLEAAFRHASSGGRRSAYLLCNPHNPTGVAHTRAELERVAELAQGFGVRVVADEIHAPLVLEGARFVPYLDVDAHGFSLMSASKAWNLAGLKSALIIGGTEVLGDLSRLSEHVGFGASGLGMKAHIAALRHGGPWLDELLAGLAENRRLFAELVARELPAIRQYPLEATYLAWLDGRGLDIEEDLATFFLERGKVALYSGEVFGTGGQRHLRVNIATTPDLLREGVRRMASAVSEVL
jgi:cysteine-S-conjugate beta-lyase